MEDFYSSILGIPVAGATLPVLAFLSLAVYGKNIILGAAVLILGIGHIGIHFIYMRHEDYLKALYLVATVDYISRKNDIPLCDKYSSVRGIRLKDPYYVGDSSLFGSDERNCIDEFLRFNIFEGDLYDAI